MCVAAVVLAPLVRSQTQSDLAKYTVGKVKSGYVYATPPTRAMEDDDFQNPGSLWVDKGKTLWSAVDGPASRANRVTTRRRRRCAASAQPTPNLTPNSAV